MYNSYYSTQAIKSYAKLPENIRTLVDSKMLVIAKDPYAKNNNITALKERKHCFRLRIGDWRVVYEIVKQELRVYVIKIGHRKEVYKL